jgi:hypothetical protein
MTDNTEEIIKRLKALEERVKHLEALEHPLITGAPVDYGPYSTIFGWSTFTSRVISCLKVGKLVFVVYRLSGESNATTISFTVPYTSAAEPGGTNFPGGFLVDNGVTLATPGRVTIFPSSTTVQIRKDMATGAFTASGTKTAYGAFFYFADN